MSGPEVSEADFAVFEQAIISVRHAVFILEQGVPFELEIDGCDPGCRHALILSDELPVATGRITANGKIGRVAVLKSHRNRGYGRAIILKLEEIARTTGLDQTYLGAQIDAIGFYQNLDYRPYGEIFMDAGIKHIHMRKSL